MELNNLCTIISKILALVRVDGCGERFAYSENHREKPSNKIDENNNNNSVRIKNGTRKKAASAENILTLEFKKTCLLRCRPKCVLVSNEYISLWNLIENRTERVWYRICTVLCSSETETKNENVTQWMKNQSTNQTLDGILLGCCVCSLCGTHIRLWLRACESERKMGRKENTHFDVV